MNHILCGERMLLQCPACGQYLDATKIVNCAEAALAGKGKNESSNL